MDFKDWFQKNSNAKVKEIVTPKGEIDDESKEQRNLESNLQSFKQQVGEEEAATPKKEPIQDIPSGTTSGHDDYILNVLHDLPEQWVGKEMKLHVIAERRVERGLITAQFSVKPSV
jgi:hypothetical protein